jgi:hypothetical protein
MKKILFYAMTFATSALSAQVTLEHSYVSSGGYNDSQKTYAFFTDSGINYYTTNEQGQVNFYNASHVLYKTVTLPLGTNFELSKVMLVTDKFFNADAKLEFIVVSNNYTPGDYEQKMTLYNEDGLNLQEFGARFTADAIKISNTEFKLIVSQDQSDSNNYDIYSVSGVLSTQQQQMIAANHPVYPNPATSRINITNPMPDGENGSVKVFAVNGAKVLEQTVNSNEKTINLDISGLASGTYIYKVNNHSGKFIKK